MGHDAASFVLGFDWTAVTLAIITLIGTVITSCASIIVTILVWTPSRTRIGKQVEDTQQIALANNYAWQRVLKHLGIDGEPKDKAP